MKTSFSLSFSLLLTLSAASPTPPSTLSERSTSILYKRAVDVLTPRWGYTVNFPGNHSEISWTEPTTRDLRITLMKGAPGQLVAIGPYDSFVDNDGRHEWLNDEYDDTDVKSGCDYKFRLAIQEDEDDFGESEYFVVVKEGDGGLTADTMCPGRRGEEGVLVRFGDIAGLAAQNTASTGSPESEDSTTETGAEDSTSETGGTSTSGSSTSGSAGEVGAVQTDDSVSTMTLIIAVVVSDVGILLLLAVLVLFGRRRSWFASRDYLASSSGVVQRPQARLEEEQGFGETKGQVQQTHMTPSGNTMGKQGGFVDVIADGSQGTYRSTRSEMGGRDVKIAQLE